MCGETHRGFESLSLRLLLYGFGLHDQDWRQLTIRNLQSNWGGAREADWARLLSECWGFTSAVGSNPTLPA